MNMSSYSCCSRFSRQSKKIASLSALLQLVSEKSRLQLLCVLKEKDRCVCELMEHVGMSQSLISHHLKDLKEGGIVAADKKGLYVYYSLTKQGNRIINLLFQILKKEVKT